MGLLHVLLVSAAAWSGPGNVVLDFSATWCNPCQEMSPLVSRLEREGLPIRKIDIEQNRELAQQYKITTIPAFVVVVNGQEVTRVVGRVSEAELRGLCARIPPAAAASVAANAPAETPTVSTPIHSAQPSPGTPVVLAAHGRPPAANRGRSRPTGAEIEVSLGEPEPAPAFVRPDARYSKAPAAPVVRAKLDESPLEAPTAVPAPLAASTRVRVKDQKGEDYGSGTIIDSQVGRTLVLTCAHVFRHWDKTSLIEVDVFTQRGVRTYVGTHIRHDKEADVGLISIPTDAPLPVCRVAPPSVLARKGLKVTSVGCSGGDRPTMRQIEITSLNRYLGPDNLECSDVPMQGRSGGGLFTQDGQLVGVCTAADPRDQRGLYAGPKAVQTLLDRCQLSHLYRGGSAGQEPVAMQGSQDSAGTDATRDSNSMGEVGGALAGHGPSPRRSNLPARMAPMGSLTTETDETDAADQPDEELVRQALQEAGHAEIVCVIRPINQPRAASRVVVINRASPRFVSYLTDELEAQQDIEQTALPAPSNTPRARRTAQRPRALASDETQGIEEPNDTEPAFAEKKNTARDLPSHIRKSIPADRPATTAKLPTTVDHGATDEREPRVTAPARGTATPRAYRRNADAR